MIPKKIHYCWFGKNKIPHKFQKFIKGWKKKCPDYEIILWNENNYDLSVNKYVKEAAKCQKWAFVSDFARIDLIERFGGIYLDTDVELLKNFDDLLDNEGFCGFECSDYINFGLGFGAVEHNPLLIEIKNYYETLTFKPNFEENETCPQIQTKFFKKHGLIQNRENQEIEHFKIFSTEYFCPKNYNSIYDNLTENSYSIHHFYASWFSKSERKEFIINNLKCKIKYKIKRLIKVL